jgi:hypothetical protein
MRKLKHLLANMTAAVAVLLSLPMSGVYAQDHSRSCNPDDPNCAGVAWNPVPGNPQTLTLAPGCVVTVNVDTRVCGTERQFRYGTYTVVPDPVTGTSNCSMFSSGSITHLIDLAVIQNQYNGAVPFCNPDDPQAGTLRVQIFSAPCYALQTCTYTFNCDAQLNCDIESGNPPFPPGPAPVIITTYQWFPCGNGCCAKEYRVCRQVSPVGTTTVHITRITTSERVPCSNPRGYPAALCRMSCD